jgi:cobalt-zinc-cadmium efflux system protein
MTAAAGRGEHDDHDHAAHGHGHGSHGHGSHGHGHGHAHHGDGQARTLWIALAATAAVAAIELYGGLLSGSLALLSDAAHVAMDVFALVIALVASVQRSRPANDRQTFGFARLEVLAALVNGGLLFAVTILIAIEAVKRFATPELPQGALMSGVAALGLAVNVGIGVMLMRGASGDLNMRAALAHVVGDALGAAAVIVGGVVILATHAAWIDPILSLFVAAIIVYGVVGIVKDASHVLLEGAPAHAQVPLVRAGIRAIEGVVDVHDLHVWTIGSGSHALAAHVLLADSRISEATLILHAIEDELRDRFDIDHTTIQFECESCDADDRIVCTQTADRRARGSMETASVE